MTAPELLIKNATIVTMNDGRTVYPSGYVAINDGCILSVGAQENCPYDTAAKVIDAQGKAILPGFVNTHTHVHDILLRGGLSDDRKLYDWLFNVIYTGLSAYGPEEIEAAGTLYCIEAIRSGITTFVDCHDFSADRVDMAVDGLISNYDRYGVRAVLARMFIDHMPTDMDAYIDAIISRGPEQRLPWDPIESTEEALASIEATIKRHHGRGDGRIQVWPSPAVATMASREGLLGAKDLARKYGTMVTGHISESRFDNRRAGVSTIEYLATIGYLDANVLAVHCVHADDNDVRILSRTGTKLSYNPRANMVLGSGFTPVVDMQTQGMITGMGTDNASANNTVNMLADMKILALAQKARYKSAVAITAEKTLEMATIEGARAIGMDKDIGSLEVGKKADIIIIDLSEAHMAPCHSLPSALVYQAMGTEIETVIVDGKILMEERTLTMLEPGEEQHLLDKAQAASDRVVVKAGLEKERAWCSYKTI